MPTRYTVRRKVEVVKLYSFKPVESPRCIPGVLPESYWMQNSCVRLLEQQATGSSKVIKVCIVRKNDKFIRAWLHHG